MTVDEYIQKHINPEITQNINKLMKNDFKKNLEDITQSKSHLSSTKELKDTYTHIHKDTLKNIKMMQDSLYKISTSTQIRHEKKLQELRRDIGISNMCKENMRRRKEEYLAINTCEKEKLYLASWREEHHAVNTLEKEKLLQKKYYEYLSIK